MQNALGTTETRTVTQHFIAHSDVAEDVLVPVGKDVEGKQVFLLDEQGREVASGEIGEIAVRSRYLSPGYWKRPEQTAKFFRDDPAGGNQRIYLTGDLGWKNANGLWVHLGRKDFQVKIRGYRIEITEVEMALTKIAGVAEAVVKTFEDATGNLQLIAYLVLQSDYAPSISELRAHLTKSLPEYSVPSRFEFLQALPLTLNGKLDRLALKPSTQAAISRTRDYVAPHGIYECALAQDFEAILGIDRVGATENFFESGGHSLLAARLALEIENRCGQVLPLSAILSAPTIQQLGCLLRKAQDALPRQSPTLIRGGDEKNPPLFCVHGSGGSAMEFQQLSRYLNQSHALYGFNPKGIDGREMPQSSARKMAALYIREMKTVQRRGPYFICGFSMGGLIAFEMASQLRAANEEVGLVALFDTHLSQRKLNFKSAARENLGFHFWQFNFAARILSRKIAQREVRQRHLVRSHLRAMNAYQPPRFDGKIAYFRAVDAQQSTPREGLDRGWHAATGAQVEVFEIIGDHSLVKEPFVQELARLLNLCLEKINLEN